MTAEIAKIPYELIFAVVMLILLNHDVNGKMIVSIPKEITLIQVVMIPVLVIHLIITVKEYLRPIFEHRKETQRSIDKFLNIKGQDDYEKDDLS